MHIQSLGQTYQQHPAVNILQQAIQKQEYPIGIQGVKGGSLAFIAARCLATTQEHQVFVFNEKEEAAYFYNDLQKLADGFEVEFFPSMYQRSIQYGKSDSGNVLIRTEILGRIATAKKPHAFIIYPESFIEKVVSKEGLQENTFQIRKGEALSRDFIVELFSEYAFERVDFVYEPGQYAVRGSLIDVFTYSGEDPYRLDFFGDEIDSIRTFDIENQLTKETVNEVSIVPNVQQKIAGETRVAVWDFFGPDTIYWFADKDFVADRFEELLQKALANRGNEVKNELRLMAETRESLLKAMDSRKLIQFGGTFHQKELVVFDMSVQPAIRKNFDLLAETWNTYSRDGYTNYILSDSQEQIERLQAIYNDRSIKAVFEPIENTIQEGFVDHDLKICCFTDHQIFERYHKFKIKSGFTKRESITLAELTNLHHGDYVVHIDHGIGKFGGLQRVNLNGKNQEAIKLIYRDNDVLFVSIHSLHRISKYKGKDAEAPKVHKLGSPVWQNLKNKTKSKVKDIAKDLIKLYAQRKDQQGFAFSPDSYLNRELEASFIYQDTPDQSKATKAVKADMEKDMPMDRLVCGDVGFGKTEIAVRAAFKAVCDNKQVAILVPTTILALQHFKTFSKRLEDLPCSVDYMSRLRTAKEQKEVKKKLEEGSLDIVVGTHKLVGQSIKFKDLGLLIIDEEQKFGVSVKEKLKQMKVNVDTLTLTATPIPRTLQFSLMGARDLSVMSTPPPNRQPIITEVHPFNELIIQEAINYEMERNGQVFFIHNRVQNIEEVAGLITKLCPKARTVFAHGQMDGKQLEQIMLDFIEGKFDVLIATTIIESGLDIPNANTIIINQAQNYGLSDLHQLRGRVGRSNKKAFCYLLAPPMSSLTSEARRRLKAIEDFSELGSGFNIALQDLDIRGAGNLLGGEQSGFIGDIGFEAFQKILSEALMELKQSDPEIEMPEKQDSRPNEDGIQRFISDCHIDTDMELIFPESYISNVAERINLYRKLDNLENETELNDYESQLIDRFGPVPEATSQLMNIVRLRWLALDLGFERIILKNNRMSLTFIAYNESPYYQTEIFQRILLNVQKFSNICKMQEKNSKLNVVFSGVKDVQKAIYYLERLKE